MDLKAITAQSARLPEPGRGGSGRARPRLHRTGAGWSDVATVCPATCRQFVALPSLAIPSAVRSRGHEMPGHEMPGQRSAPRRIGDGPRPTAPIKASWALLVAVALIIIAGCEPRVRLEAPREPIVIHLDVKIEHEVRVRVEREIQDVIRENRDIF
jgi:hypothetical protein